MCQASRFLSHNSNSLFLSSFLWQQQEYKDSINLLVCKLYSVHVTYDKIRSLMALLLDPSTIITNLWEDWCSWWCYQGVKMFWGKCNHHWCQIGMNSQGDSMGHPGSSISGCIKKRSSNNCFEFDSKGVHDFMYSRFLFQLSFFFLKGRSRIGYGICYYLNWKP